MERFSRWLETHKQDRVTAEMETSFDDWLRGHVSGLKPGLVTVSNVSDDKTRPPYRHYVKYSVVNEPAAEAQTDCDTPQV